jgi:hypothetical protein
MFVELTILSHERPNVETGIAQKRILTLLLYFNTFLVKKENAENRSMEHKLLGLVNCNYFTSLLFYEVFKVFPAIGDFIPFQP